MRDILLFGFFAVLLVMTFRDPYYGGLGWALFGVMNPHRLTFGIGYDFPFAMIIAIATLVSMLRPSTLKRVKGGKAALVLVLLLGWCTLTTYFAFHPADAEIYLSRMSKILMMTLVLLLLVNTRQQVVMLVGVLALSLGFYGVKGGIFTIANGGQNMVNGPPGSVMDGNNALGVGLTMSIPLMYFLYLQPMSRRWMKPAMMAAMVLSAVAVLGTYSRGALLAVVAMVVLLWLRSRSKVLLSAVAVAFVLLAVPLMPGQWFDRMGTIKSHEEDTSAMGRIYAWQTATNIAIDRFPLAGGFEWNGLDTSARYSPAPDYTFVAHSIYFQILGSQGFIGLLIYLSFWLAVLAQTMWLRRHCRKDPELDWAHQLASMVQVSLLGYAVGGAFLDLAFWDMPYYLYAAVAGAVYVVRQRQTVRLGNPQAAPGPGAAGGGATGSALPA